MTSPQNPRRGRRVTLATVRALHYASEPQEKTMARYEDFYNRAGMLGDYERVAIMRLPDADRFALVDEHHRRTEMIAEACERGEVVDWHDARFSLQPQGGKDA